jgi:hypothetical protein
MKKSPFAGDRWWFDEIKLYRLSGSAALAQGAMTFFRYASQNKSCGFLFS